MILFSDDKLQIDSSAQSEVIWLQEKKPDNCVCSEKDYLKRCVSAAPSKYIIIFYKQFV